MAQVKIAAAAAGARPERQKKMRTAMQENGKVINNRQDRKRIGSMWPGKREQQGARRR